MSSDNKDSFSNTSMDAAMPSGQCSSLVNDKNNYLGESEQHSNDTKSNSVNIAADESLNNLNGGYVRQPRENEENLSKNAITNLSDNDGIHCSESMKVKESVDCDNAAETSVSQQSEDSVIVPDKLIDEEKIDESMNNLIISGDPIVKTGVIVKNLSESLQNILAYDGDSSSEDEEDITSKNSGTSESSGTSSESDFSWGAESDSGSDSDCSVIVAVSDKVLDVNVNQNTGAVKKITHAGYDPQEFLNPIPDISKLSINMENEEFLHIGSIGSIISEIVTVATIKFTPAFDINTLLFVEDGKDAKKPLGPVFDVFGPVSEPIYCIRFNTAEEIANLCIKPGLKVFVAPKNDCTKFVFIKELIKMKGSDASWLNDQEQPPEMAEYSDDEKEREARRQKKKTVKRKFEDTGNDDKHKRFEAMMNHCNMLNNRVSRMIDSQEAGNARPINISHIWPPFDPTVPPPGFGPTMTMIDGPSLFSMYHNMGSSTAAHFQVPRFSQFPDRIFRSNNPGNDRQPK